jgi:hypothetical protein
MSSKLPLLGLTAAIFVATLMFYVKDKPLPEVANTQPAKIELIPGVLPNASNNPEPDTKEHSSASTANQLRSEVSNNTEDSNAFITELAKPTESAFLKSFNTEQQINDTYINQDDAIYQSALITSFKTEDFSTIIASLNSVEKNSNATENELKLGNTLMQQYGSTISNEKYSCAGRICAVMFNYPPDTDKEKLRNLHNYGSHYSFYNDSIDEYGNPVMKAIFVSTDDPSKLTIAR